MPYDRVRRALSKLFYNATCGFKKPFVHIVDYILWPCPAVIAKYPNRRYYYVYALCPEAFKVAESILGGSIVAEYLLARGECPRGWSEKRRCGEAVLCSKKPERGLELYLAMG